MNYEASYLTTRQLFLVRCVHSLHMPELIIQIKYHSYFQFHRASFILSSSVIATHIFILPHIKVMAYSHGYSKTYISSEDLILKTLWQYWQDKFWLLWTFRMWYWRQRLLLKVFLHVWQVAGLLHCPCAMWFAKRFLCLNFFSQCVQLSWKINNLIILEFIQSRILKIS